MLFRIKNFTIKYFTTDKISRIDTVTFLLQYPYTIKLIFKQVYHYLKNIYN